MVPFLAQPVYIEDKPTGDVQTSKDNPSAASPSVCTLLRPTVYRRRFVGFR